MIKHHALWRSDGLRSSIVMIGGNLFAQGLSGLVMIALSRVIGPSQFGMFSIGFSLAMILLSLLDIGLTAALPFAIPRAEGESERNRLFGTALVIKALCYAGLLVLAPLISPFLSQRLHLPSPQLMLWITIALAGSLYFNQLTAMLLSLKRVSQSVTINVGQALAKIVLLAVVVRLAYHSGEGIVLLYLAIPGLVIPLTSLLMPAWYRFRPQADTASWRALKGMALNNWVASLGSMIVQNADLLLVGMLLSPAAAGLMGAASRLAMFILLIGSSLTGVLNPRVAGYRLQRDLSAYWRKALLIFGACLVLAASSFLISRPLLALTSGQAYVAGAPALGWLLAASWLAVGIAPLSALFYSYEKAWYFSVSMVIQAVLLLAGNGVLLPQYGIVAAGWTRLAAQLATVGFTLCLALFSHRQRYHRWPELSAH